MWSAGNENATYTLQNCMVFPLILSYLANGSLVQHPANLTNKYAIGGTNGFYKTTAGLAKIYSCIISYCNEAGTGSGQNYACAGMYDGEGGPRVRMPFWHELCPLDDQSLNSDIGGAGVRIEHS